MNFCQFEKDPRIYLKQLQKKRSKKTSKPKTNTKNGVFKRTKLKATIKPKVSVDKYKQKLEGMIETCVQTRLTEFTQDFQKMIMEKTTILSNGNTNAKIEKDIESLKNEIQKIISKLPNSNVVNKDIHYFRIQQEQIIEQIQNLQVDVSQLKQEVVPIVHETIDPWDDGHGNQLSSPRKTTPEPVNKDTTPEPKEDNVPEITTNEITEAHNNIVEEEPVAKAN